MKIKLSILFLLYIISCREILSQSTCTAISGSFIENNGQWDKEIQYCALLNGYSVQIKNHSIQLVFNNIETCLKSNSNEQLKNNRDYYWKNHQTIFDLSFQSSNNIIAQGFNKHDYYLNYLIGNNPCNWISQVSCYNNIRINGLYEGLDALLYFEDNQLRFDFIIQPNTNPDLISLDLSGNADAVISSSGNLIICSDKDTIEFKSLYAFQEIDGEKNEIGCSFVKERENIEFELGDYNKNVPLIIDPLVYSTFLCGSNYDYGEDMKIDSAGNAYIVGYTSSADFPVDSFAYQNGYKENNFNYPDAFVSKFDSTGKLLFSTFIGGYADDYGKGIAIDNAHNIYITGYTSNSSTFPTTSGAYDTTHNGGYDIFVSKLNPEGTALIYSTFIGSKNDDYSQAITIDKNGSTYITGFTKFNSTFPLTATAVQTKHNGENDAFVCKLSANGDSLLYSTFIGGEDEDFGQDIVVDTSGLIYITGITRSALFPTTLNALFKQYNDSLSNTLRSDAFLVKLNPSDTSIAYSTYLGGKSRDGGYAIEIDKIGNIYIAGYTESDDFPTTVKAFNKSYHSSLFSNNAGDAFITKFSRDLKIIEYSTFIGGSSTDKAYSIALDTAYNAYITGITSSKDFPITDITGNHKSGDTLFNPDAFAFKIDSAGSCMLYSTFIGGAKSDIGNSIAVLRSKYIYVAGTTNSKDFPTTKNSIKVLAVDTNKSDAFLSIFDPQKLIAFAGDSATICQGQSVQLGGGFLGGIGSMTFTWEPSYGLSDTTIARPIASPSNSTSYTVTITDQGGYIARDTVYVTVLQTVIAIIFGSKFVYQNSKNIYATYPDVNCIFNWNVEGGYIDSGNTTNRIVVVWTDSTSGRIRLITENYNGCRDTSMFYNVSVGGVFRPVIIPLGSPDLCNGDTLVLDGGEGYIEYMWSDGTRARHDSITKAGDYWLVVADSVGNIGFSDTLKIRLFSKLPKPIIIFKEAHLICISILDNYQWYKNNILIPGEIYKNYRPTRNGFYKLGVRGNNGCVSLSDPIQIIIDNVEDVIGNQIKVIPNPADDMIELHATKILGDVDIRISDILGRIVFQRDYLNPGDKISISLASIRISTGLYFITITDKQLITTFPILIK